MAVSLSLCASSQARTGAAIAGVDYHGALLGMQRPDVIVFECGNGNNVEHGSIFDENGTACQLLIR